MKKIFTTLLASAAFCGAAHAVILVGNDPLSDNGGADGWSGITVLETAMTAPSGTVAQVTNWNYWDDRGSGNHNVTPLLLQNVGGAYSIIGIGTPNTAAATGIQSIVFGLTSGTDIYDTSTAGTTYHAGVFQVDLTTAEDTNDGTIPFAGAGGAGMFQMNVLDTYVPALADPIVGGHASAAGGRDYMFNFDGSAVPEPSVFGLVGIGGLMVILRRRRK